MLSKFYIMCSYPSVHTVAAFSTVDEARDAFCDQYSGQTDEQNYYWTEADCDRHGRVGLTAQSECELCDQARAGEYEQDIRDADAEFDGQGIDGDPEAERERYERCEAEEYDRAFRRGLIAPRDVYLFGGRLVLGGEYDPRYASLAPISRVEAIEYLGALYVRVPEAYRQAWVKRDYAGMLDALVEVMGMAKLLACLQQFDEAEKCIYVLLDPLNDLTD